jgi:adenylate/guanylate cyclase family protein
MGDRSWGELIERHHATVRALSGRYRGNEVDTAGDGFFATFDGPARAVRCAEAIIESVQGLGLQVRAGIHTGEVETIDGKAGGIAVNIGARVAAEASASQVLVSQTVKDLVAGSGLTFEDAGEYQLRGVPDTWRLYPGGRSRHLNIRPVHETPTTQGAPHPAPQSLDGIGRGGGPKVVQAVVADPHVKQPGGAEVIDRGATPARAFSSSLQGGVRMVPSGTPSERRSPWERKAGQRSPSSRSQERR